MRVELLITGAVLLSVVSSSTRATAQAAASPAQRTAPTASPRAPWTAPRTPDGRPDLQGNWSNATLTTLQRPAGLPLVLSNEQVARLEKVRADSSDKLDQASDPNRTAPPLGGDGSTGAAGNVGGYNNFWIDAGDRVARVNGEFRSSFITDPPNGLVPPLTPAGRARQIARVTRQRQFGEYDNPENRPLAERCIMSFGSNAGPPMLPNYFYNNNYTIVQTRDHVMIMTEMVHDARIIPLSGTAPRTGTARPWMGESVGRWVGDTLVVETAHIRPEQLASGTTSMGGALMGASDSLRVVERFSRADEFTMLYRFTIDDPSTYTQPWSGEVPFLAMDDLLYEYACHEGNYALSNILSGARAAEREAAARPAATKPKPNP